MLLDPGPPRRRSGVRGLGPLVLVAWAVVLVTGVPALLGLGGVQSDDPVTFLPTGSGSARAEQRLGEVAGARSEVAQVVLARDDGAALDPAALAAAGDLAAALPDRVVTGLDHGARLGAYLTVDRVPVVPSPDGRAVLLVLPFAADRVDGSDAQGRSARVVVVDAVREGVADRVRSGPLRGTTAHLTGPLGLTADLVEVLTRADTRLLPVALLAVLLILLALYRSAVLAMAVIGTSVAALALAALVVRALAGHAGLVVSGQARSIMAILVVGAATDYSMLLLARHREELERPGAGPADHAAALGRARRAVVEPVVASAATVVAALGCLLLSTSGANRSLGPVAAIGVGAAVAAALTLLPVLPAGWAVPGSRSAGRAPGERDRAGRRGGPRPSAGLWDRVARLVRRRARRTWAITAGCLAAAAVFAPTFDSGGTSQSAAFLTPQGSVVGQELAREHFPAAVVEPTVVMVPAGQVGRTVRVAGAAEGVVSAAPGPADARWGQVTVGLRPGADTPAAAQAVRALRSDLASAGLDAAVGGPAAVGVDLADGAARDRGVVIPAVLGVVLVVLVVLLRSLLAAALLVACNLLSFAAAVGVAALVFPRVLGSGGADPLVVLSAFVFLVALGIDYSIFLMTRVRSESVVRGTRPGVLVGLRRTGVVITGAGVVLAATFASLTTVPLLFLVQVGSLVAFGVLVDTVVVRSLLVPALVHDLGHRTWWPGSPEPAVPAVVDVSDPAQAVLTAARRG